VIDGGDSPPWAGEVSTDALAPVLLEYFSAG